jgi:hypothetical protein
MANELRNSDPSNDGGFLWNRRTVAQVLLGGVLAGSGLPSLWRSPAEAASPAIAPLPKPRAIKYFTLDGAGAMDGSTWQDAMPLPWLKRSFPFGEPGLAFFVGFDEKQGAAQKLAGTLANLASSGAAGNPIQLQSGYISPQGELTAISPEAGAVFSSGAQWTINLAVSKKSPRAFIGLIKGASHIAISGFQVDGTGPEGFFKFGPDAAYEDVLFRNLNARNVGRVIETAKTASLRNITIEDCQAIGIIRGFARFWDMSDSTLRNMVLDANNMNAGIRNPCQLISLVKGSNVTFENLTLRNAYNDPLPGDPPGKSYIQGDGIVCERETRDVTIRNCHASNMGDGGFDVKTVGVTIEDSSGVDCKFGARIWSQAENVIRRCNFKASKPVASWTSGCVQSSGRVQIIETTMEAGPGTVAIDMHQLANNESPNVQVTGGSITIHEGARLVGGKGVLDLKDVTVNGELKTQRIEL